MAKEVTVCKECGVVQILESAYDKMTELDKAEYVAQQTAQEFLENIAEGYDEDSSPRFENMLGEKSKFLDKPERIPVLSDANIAQLQKLLVNFFTRNINLEFKSKVTKETQNGTKNN